MPVRRRRAAAVLAAALLAVCAACTDPHSGDWTSGTQSPSESASATAQAMAGSDGEQPEDGTVEATEGPGDRSEAGDEEETQPAGLTPLEEWLLDGFISGGYPEASVRVHGSDDAWVAGGLNQNAPERFAHAWPTEKTELYAGSGTVLRSTQVAGTEVQVLQHVWGVSARFECGQATVDTYAQSQVEQNQAEAEALSLAEVLIDPLACTGGGFQP